MNEIQLIVVTTITKIVKVFNTVDEALAYAKQLNAYVTTKTFFVNTFTVEQEELINFLNTL